MSDSLPPPRLYFTPPPFLRLIGCSGCGLGCLAALLLVFLLGGVFGWFLFGWKILFGS
jgi:hypothetical protein